MLCKRQNHFLKIKYALQTTLLTMFLLTGVIEVTEDGSVWRYGKSQSIFLIMYIHQRKTAELCNYFLFFWIYWGLLRVQSLPVKNPEAFLHFNGFLVSRFHYRLILFLLNTNCLYRKSAIGILTIFILYYIINIPFALKLADVQYH